MNVFQISDIAVVKTGGTPSRKEKDFYTNGNNLWVKTQELLDSKIWDTEEKITDLAIQKSNAKLLPENTILLAMYGATVGKLGILKSEATTNQACAGIICNKTKVNYLYLYYSLAVNRQRIISLAQGAAQQNINLSVVKNFQVTIPQLNIQYKIASILSSFDDLIENNDKRIKVLEEIAKSVYKEWFIVKKSSEWKEIAINEIANVYRGKSYKGSELSETVGVPFITIKCINRGGGFRFDGLKLFNGQAKESNTVKPGDIVIAVTDMTQERMIVARPARIPKLKTSNPFVFSMDLVKVLAKDNNYQNFLYGFFMYSGFGDLVKNYANGVNVLHLSQDHIANAKLLLPEKLLIEKYDKVVSPIYQEMDNLQLKNEVLLKTKNLLLPKLISGDLDVEGLDIKIRPEIL